MKSLTLIAHVLLAAGFYAAAPNAAAAVTTATPNTTAASTPAAPFSNADILQAAQDEIQNSIETQNTDTQCSDYVAKVLRRLGVAVGGFRANDFNQVVAAKLPALTLAEFTTADIDEARAQLASYLDSFADHTAFFAQWPRIGQSGHVAIIEKFAAGHYLIDQAQAGLSLPHSEPIQISSLLYGLLPVGRSHLRLYGLPSKI